MFVTPNTFSDPIDDSDNYDDNNNDNYDDNNNDNYDF